MTGRVTKKGSYAIQKERKQEKGRFRRRLNSASGKMKAEKESSFGHSSKERETKNCVRAGIDEQLRRGVKGREGREVP